MKNIILCADDYGQNSSISQAIIALIEKKRLSATSCMTTSDYWPEAARLLRPLCHTVDVGLHFNLTEGKSLSKNYSPKGFSSLLSLLVRSTLRLLSQRAIEAELNAQIDQFVACMGQLPDFIDGHRHVHQMPVVRDALFAVYETRLRSSGAYIRCADNRMALSTFKTTAWLRRLIIQVSGGHRFKRLLLQRAIPHNMSFAGLYDFSTTVDYAEQFPHILDEVGQDGLIMCHPGLGKEDASESCAREFHYFLSEKFVEDCVRQQVTLKHKTPG